MGLQSQTGQNFCQNQYFSPIFTEAQNRLEAANEQWLAWHWVPKAVHSLPRTPSCAAFRKLYTSVSKAFPIKDQIIFFSKTAVPLNVPTSPCQVRWSWRSFEPLNIYGCKGKLDLDIANASWHFPTEVYWYAGARVCLEPLIFPMCLEDVHLYILRDWLYLESADTHHHMQELEKIIMFKRSGAFHMPLPSRD